MWAFDLKNRWNLPYLGDYDIKSGLPPFTIPDMKNIPSILPGAIMICMNLHISIHSIGVVGYVITVSLGKIFARRFSYSIDDNQELIAMGAANLMGAFFSCYPPAGSLGRSALVANCGISFFFDHSFYRSSYGSS